MPTNRSIYFELNNLKNKYLTRLVIKSLLNYANGYYNDIDLYKNFDKECDNYETLLSMIERVKNGEPYQYVLGYANFIDRFFKVTPDVLIPRQETEQLVISTKKYIEKYFKNSPTIADVCTGSGCIAVSIKRYFPDAKVYGTDISKNAITVASENSSWNKQDVTFLEGNILEPLIDNHIQLDVLICNPPYIENEKEIDEQVYKYEPHLALLAKPSTKYYEEIFKNADKVMNDNCIMAFEIGEDMEDALSIMVENYFPTAAYIVSKDMYGKTRFLFIIRREDMNYA